VLNGVNKLNWRAFLRTLGLRLAQTVEQFVSTVLPDVPSTLAAQLGDSLETTSGTICSIHWFGSASHFARIAGKGANCPAAARVGTIPATRPSVKQESRSVGCC